MLGKIHWFLFFSLVSIILGAMYPFKLENPFTSSFDVKPLTLDFSEVKKVGTSIQESIEVTNTKIRSIQMKYKMEKVEVQHQSDKMKNLISQSQSHVKLSEDILDQLHSSLLGKPIGQTFGEKATIKVYTLEEAGYRGYMAKIKLHDPKAIKMSLAGNSIVSKGETTSQAARRNDATLAINAGGFFKKGNSISPVGITVIDGQVRTFSNSGTSFIGFNSQGQLVGGIIKTKEQLEKMNVLNGASFLPTLLKNGNKLSIPKDWANTKQPRTLIGHFINGDILIIVIDGRRKGWSTGVTLEEAQEKLLEFKVKDAYNLDGGGSSTFYYKGKVLNKPSDGRERSVTTNLLVFP